jgi:hypothetical protein
MTSECGADLECIDGVCTKWCSDKSSCSGAPRAATCGPSTSGGGSRVCVPCPGDAGCGAVAQSVACAGDAGCGASASNPKVPAIGQPTTLATAVNPEQIVVDTTSVYWLEASYGSNQQPNDPRHPQGALMKMPIGGGSPEVLAAPAINQAPLSGGVGPTLALDAANVYWVWTSVGSDAGAGGSVMKVPLGGGAPVVLASGQDVPSAIAVDGSHVYWTTTSSLMSVPIEGGAAVELASWNPSPGAGMNGIAVDGSSVYWTVVPDSDTNPADGGPAFTTLFKVSTAGGKSVMVSNLLWTATEIAAHDGYIYGYSWIPGGIQAGSNYSALVRVPVGGGAPTELVWASEWHAPGTVQRDTTSLLRMSAPIAVDGTNLYWIASSTSTPVGAVMSSTLYGTMVTTLTTGPANTLAVTPTHLYWGHAYNSTDGAPGVLMSAPLL